MSHSHSHSHAVEGDERRMALSIVLTIAFVAGEAGAGLYAHSLALLSDAGHNLSDALALILSWYAMRVAKRPADAKRTFGSHRVGILVALINAVSLVVMAVWIFGEAIGRLRNPEPVQSGPMIVVALIAVALNGMISLWLRSGAKHDLNLRSAYLHMLGDAVSAAGVAVAGVIVAFTGASIADPIVSMLIGALILVSSWGILKESVEVLLECAPADLDMAALEQAARNVPNVVGLHDLHVWTIGSGIVACSCHVVVTEQSVREGQEVLRQVATLLKNNYGIGHTTIQVEVEGCNADTTFCTLRPVNNAGHEHAHEHEHKHGDCH